MSKSKKVVIAITGASGSIYAKRLFHFLSKVKESENIEVGVVLSNNAATVWNHELKEIPDIPFKTYSIMDFSAPFASGSAKYTDMVIIPCSMGTMGRIANGLSENLITRAADVILKERRKLICVIRDTPLNIIHIENMLKITQAGGIILPAAPSFYSNPNSIEELVDTVIHRVLDLIQVDVSCYRWGNGKKLD